MARQDIGAVIGVGLLISVMLACVSPVEAARANEASSKKMDLNALVNRALAGIESEDESAAAKRAEDGSKAGTEGVSSEGAVASGLKGAEGVTAEPTSTHGPATDVPEVVVPIDLGRSPAAKPVRAVVMTQKPAPSAGGLSGPGDGKPRHREKMRSPIPREYRIKAGDTLGHIAQRFYGRAREHAAIVKANPGIDPLRLQVGQMIRLPRRAKVDVVERAAAPGASGAADRLKTDEPRGVAGVQRRVVVRSGDSLYRIAERAYGDGGRWRELYEANREVIEDPAMIQIGMALVVPKRGTAQVERGR